MLLVPRSGGFSYIIIIVIDVVTFVVVIVFIIISIISDKLCNSLNIYSILLYYFLLVSKMVFMHMIEGCEYKT